MADDADSRKRPTVDDDVADNGADNAPAAETDSAHKADEISAHDEAHPAERGHWPDEDAAPLGVDEASIRQAKAAAAARREARHRAFWHAVWAGLVIAAGIGIVWLVQEGRFDQPMAKLRADLDAALKRTQEMVRGDPDAVGGHAAGADAPVGTDIDLPPEISREEMRRIETMLTELGFQPGEIDGAPDEQTSAAIREYQKVTGLPITGEPSQGLLRELTEVAGNLKPKGETSGGEGADPGTTGTADGGGAAGSEAGD